MTKEKDSENNILAQRYKQDKQTTIHFTEYTTFDPYSIIASTPVTVGDREKYCSEVKHKGVLAQFSVFSIKNRPFTYFLTLHQTKENSEAAQEVFRAFQAVLGINVHLLKTPRYVLDGSPQEERQQTFKWVSVKAD